MEAWNFLTLWIIVDRQQEVTAAQKVQHKKKYTTCGPLTCSRTLQNNSLDKEKPKRTIIGLTWSVRWIKPTTKETKTEEEKRLRTLKRKEEFYKNWAFKNPLVSIKLLREDVKGSIKIQTIINQGSSPI